MRSGANPSLPRRARNERQQMSGNVPSPNETNLFRIVRGIRDLFEGRRNTAGTVTLATGSATTTVSHLNFGKDSVPILTPLHANAATEVNKGIFFSAAIIIAGFVTDQTSSPTLMNAGGVLAVVPPLVLALIFQRLIVSGITAGAVKG